MPEIFHVSSYFFHGNVRMTQRVTTVTSRVTSYGEEEEEEEKLGRIAI
jgi:hypothetical protein